MSDSKPAPVVEVNNSEEVDVIPEEFVEVGTPVESPVASPVASPVEEVAAPRRIEFLMDVESKALVETISPALEDFSINNLMSILPQLMKHVKKYKSLSGLEKRSMVISMLKHIIDITDGPGNDALWDPILKNLVPSIIDTLVEVDKGNLRINRNNSCMRKLLGCIAR